MWHVLFAKKMKKIRQIWPRRSLKHFTAAYRGYSNVLACKWRLTFILWNCSSIFFIVFSSVQKSKYLPLKIIDVVLVGFRINKQFRACIRLSYFQLPISILHEDHWSVKLKYIFNFEGWWWYDEGMSSQQGFIRHRPIWNTQNNDRRNKLYKLNIKT